MNDIAKRVAVTVLGGAITAFVFTMADMAMPDDVQWWMRWVLAAVSFVSYGAGGAMGAYQTHGFYRGRTDSRATGSEAERKRTRRKEQAAVRDFREGVAFDTKVALARILDDGYVAAGGADPADFESAFPGIGDWVEFEQVGEDSWRLTLRDEGRAFLARDPDLLSAARGHVA